MEYFTYNEQVYGTQMSRIYLLLIVFCALTASCRKNAQSTHIHDKYQQALVLLGRNPDSAGLWFNRQLSSAPPLADSDKYLQYDFLRQYWIAKGDFEQALKIADSCILAAAKLKTNNSNLLLAKAYISKGNILFDVKNFNAAYDAYYQAEALASKLKSHCEYSSFIFDLYVQIANINFGDGRFRESAKWHQKAIDALNECAVDFNQAYKTQGALDNIGLCYLLMDDEQKALLYFEQANQYLNTINAPDDKSRHDIKVARGVILGNIGGAYAKLGNYAKAKLYLKQSIDINARPGFAIGDALITKVKLGEVYLNINRIDSAAMLVEQVKNERRLLTTPADVLQFQLFEARVLSRLHAFKSADSLYQVYIRESAQLRQTRLMTRNIELKDQFESIDKQYALETLEHNNRDQKLSLAFVALLSVAAGIAAFVFYRQKSKINRYAKEIQKHAAKQELLMAAYEKSSMENDRLVKIVAHDLRNPLSAMTTVIHLISSHPDLDPDIQENLHILQMSVDQLQTLTADLLLQNKKEVDKSLKQRCQVVELLEDNLRLLQFQASKKNQKLILEAEPGVTAPIVSERIWRVINNLVSNAIKFSFDNSDILVRCYRKADLVYVEVKDQGVGIPEALKDSLFELAAVAGRQGTGGEETNGLGLLISKEIIEQHGGKIWFESAEGKGSSFFFTLPAN